MTRSTREVALLLLRRANYSSRGVKFMDLIHFPPCSQPVDPRTPLPHLISIIFTKFPIPRVNTFARS